jgi:hypothetical protein
MKEKTKGGKKTARGRKAKPIFWRNFFYRAVYWAADTPLPEIAFLSSFILSRWYINSDFSYPSEVWLPIIMFGILGSIAFYGYRLIFGKGSAAHLAAILLSYGLYAYNFIEESKAGSIYLKIIPHHFRTDFTQSVVLFIGMAILAGAVAWTIRWLLRHFARLQKVEPYKVLLFAVVFIFGIQAVHSASRYFHMRKQLSYHYPVQALGKPNATTVSKPDIYYLLFDRYGNKEQLEKNFNFDNSDIYSFLASKGFANRPDASANYPFTMSSVSSTMAMNYFPQFEEMFSKNDNWQTAFPYRSILNDPPIAQELKQNGYQYNQLSSWWDFTRVGIKADSNPDESFRLRVFGKAFYLTDLQRDIVNKSILSPWLKKGVGFGKSTALKYDLDRNPRENFEAQMSSLRDIAGRTDKSKPQFSFAHLLAPHPPYVFNADGSWPSYDGEANDNGVDETIKYKNEATFVNDQIKDVVSYIQLHDPKAVIVIQADEGPYPKQFRGPLSPEHFYDPLKLPQDKMRQKFGVFASYYLPGDDNSNAASQIDASVDTFRVILNNYLGYNLVLLPDCHFSTGDKFQIYNYTLVNDKLQDQKDTSACAKYK